MGAMELRPDSRGKVRDIYDCGDSLLMVASDRISAFDVILPDEIPHKGEVLTRLSALVHPLFRGWRYRSNSTNTQVKMQFIEMLLSRQIAIAHSIF